MFCMNYIIVILQVVTIKRYNRHILILLDFSLTVKAVTLIFISGCGSATSSAKEGKSGFIYSLENIK